MKRKLVSLKEIANKLKQNPIMADMGWEFMVSRAAEFLDLIGSEAIYVNVPLDLEIKNGRALLPVDVMGINGVGKVQGDNLIAMTPSDDYLNDTNIARKNNQNVANIHTYSVSHSAIFTNFDSGNIIISYKTLATDEDCFPLIPGDAETTRAVESYLRWKWYDILNDLDQISDRKLAKVETEYAFNAGQCQASSTMPNVDEMEALVNQITQILPDRRQHAQRFQFLGTQEKIKIQ